MEGTESLKVEIVDHIATVTLDRPPVNATNHGVFFEITDVFSRLSENPDARVIVFTGAGPHFCGGADLKDSRMQKIAGSQDTSVATEFGATRVTDSGRIAREAFWSILDCSIPVISAIHGVAVGAGMAFAAVSDFVVASEDARFGMTEINVGILGGSSFLMRVMNFSRARYMFFTGNLVTAQELLDWGAIHAVTSREEMLPKAYELAAELASKSPIGLRLAKESLLRSEHLHIKDAYRIEQDYTRRLSRFEDSTEARTAWAEKRSPDFQWK